MESACNSEEIKSCYTFALKAQYHVRKELEEIVQLAEWKILLLESIRKSVVHKKTTIKEIVLSCASTSYEIYDDEMKRLSKEILDLRRWLREAQQQNKEMSHDVTKKVKEVERKERIILEKMRK
ncbi:hypothetical protein GLOIN_2v1786010 [Rhizophagus irregularis DAOM 181602=DAOM 197198]|uniref:Uncharacterized protein n=2 Tax=Rhizophagus irregularis TaxID=588596 RepID=A0A015IYK5_RHIIW|nr:hypothetical protein RirG_162510 [Rhizophagus irregularis DAOM 197198w]GBC27563.1 hypothetical protein GLOIN_2v1786010 [Rhizophagus irregularis DAOM 181602=DAOM 197198]